MTYEQQALREAERYLRSLDRKSSIINRTSKKVQTKINNKIPDKVHQVVTESIKRMIELALTSSQYIHPIDVDAAWKLEKREEMINERIRQYKRTAMIEGAGTGAGGIWLGLADFPLLLSIKMKLLFDIGQLYGFDVKNYQERMYLLHVFMLAFSSDNKRYRDTIDFVKMMQLIPGFGALVGAVANRKLLDQLAETAMNAYRVRLLQ